MLKQLVGGKKKRPKSAATNEIQVLIDQKSPEIAWTDITDSRRFTCQAARPAIIPRNQRTNLHLAPRPLTEHPSFEFKSPHNVVHFQMINYGNHGEKHVTWDEYFDLHGYNRLGPTAQPLPMSKMPFWTFCSNTDKSEAMSHLVVTEATAMKEDPVKDFIGSVTLHSYNHEDDPEQSAFQWKAMTRLRKLSDSLRSLFDTDPKTGTPPPPKIQKTAPKLMPLIGGTPVEHHQLSPMKDFMATVTMVPVKQ